MRFLLDTRVLLAAADSATGASRFVLEHAGVHEWQRLTSTNCVEETDRNVRKLGPKAAVFGRTSLLPHLTLVPIEGRSCWLPRAPRPTFS